MNIVTSKNIPFLIVAVYAVILFTVYAVALVDAAPMRASLFASESGLACPRECSRDENQCLCPGKTFIPTYPSVHSIPPFQLTHTGEGFSPPSSFASIPENQPTPTQSLVGDFTRQRLAAESLLSIRRQQQTFSLPVFQARGTLPSNSEHSLPVRVILFAEYVFQFQDTGSTIRGYAALEGYLSIGGELTRLQDITFEESLLTAETPSGNPLRLEKTAPHTWQGTITRHSKPIAVTVTKSL